LHGPWSIVNLNIVLSDPAIEWDVEPNLLTQVAVACEHEDVVAVRGDPRERTVRMGPPPRYAGG
jgi:hypothetical protein